MILDSSAVIGILLREPQHQELQSAIGSASDVGIGAATAVETGIILAARLGASGKSLLARFFEEGEVEILPVTVEHWTIAVDAFLRYGKGRHAAALNFGDCLTYAVARRSGRPLLCVGSDFPQTDLVLA